MLQQVLDRVCEDITRESLEGQKPLSYEIISSHFGSTLSVDLSEPQFDEDGQGLLFSPSVPVTTEFKRVALPFLTWASPESPMNIAEGLRARVKATRRCSLNGTVYISKESLEPYLGQTGRSTYGSLYSLLVRIVGDSPPATEDPEDLLAWEIMRVFQGKSPS
mgnify:FL=1